MMTTTLIISGLCLGMIGAPMRWSWTNCTYGARLLGNKFCESQKLGRAGSGSKGCRVEMKAGNRIDLEYRIFGIVPGAQGFRYGVEERRDGLLAEKF